MNKFILILTALMMSRLTISQTLNTSPETIENCKKIGSFIPTPQITEIYKVVRQGEYCCEKLDKAKTTIASGEKLIAQQATTISNLQQKTEIQENIIAITRSECAVKQQQDQAEIDILNQSLKQQIQTTRNRTWLYGAGGFVAGALLIAVVAINN